MQHGTLSELHMVSCEARNQATGDLKTCAYLIKDDFAPLLPKGRSFPTETGGHCSIANHWLFDL